MKPKLLIKTDPARVAKDIAWLCNIVCSRHGLATDADGLRFMSSSEMYRDDAPVRRKCTGPDSLPVMTFVGGIEPQAEAMAYLIKLANDYGLPAAENENRFSLVTNNLECDVSVFIQNPEILHDIVVTESKRMNIKKMLKCVAVAVGGGVLAGRGLHHKHQANANGMADESGLRPKAQGATGNVELGAGAALATGGMYGAVQAAAACDDTKMERKLEIMAEPGVRALSVRFAPQVASYIREKAGIARN